MNRRKFLSTLGIGAVVGAMPLSITVDGVTKEISAPICGGCGQPLVLKGKDTNVFVSCSNEKCVSYWDDDLVERCSSGPLSRYRLAESLIKKDG